jgi:COP9 signalosome complex subunit 5
MEQVTTTAAAGTPTVNSADSYYGYDMEVMSKIKSSAPWMKDPKYFKRVKISPSAIVKMMTHSQSGVEKGLKQNGKPLEVMGLLFGHPDVEDLHCLIVTDAQPIPAEGFETKVVIDDQSVINHMIDLRDVTEETSKFSYCGWYHTHPFDLDGTSHCYLSSTDMNTQRQWQRLEDPHGNPWLALVIDPLRSIAKGSPELMAFRAYPVEYEPPANETPDGTLVHEELRAIEKWGVCWRGYYKLETSYFMSSLASNVLTVLKNKFLWMNSFTQQPLENGRDPVLSLLSLLSLTLCLSRCSPRN